MKRRSFLLLILTVFTFIAVSCGSKDNPNNGGGNGGDNGGGNTNPTITVPDKEGMTVKGVVVETGTMKPIEGVVVSDGMLCTKTDKDGIFYLKTDLKTQRFCFVIVPSEYEVPMSSSECFNAYKKFNGTNKVQECKFALTKRTTPCDHYYMCFSGDPQIRDNSTNKNDDSYVSLQFVCDRLKAWSETLNFPVYKTELGDLAWNNHSYYDSYKRFMASAGIPTFNLPGNHDHNQEYCNEYTAITDYVNAFGPNNYAVNIGKIHYIFADSMIWGDIPAAEQVDGNYYKTGFNDEAATFIENDMKYVPAGMKVVFCCHIPVTRAAANWRKNYSGYQRVNDALAGRDVQMWYGHWHSNSTYEYTVEDLKNPVLTKAKSLTSHVVVRCAGALKTNKEIAKDGCPRGVVVTEVNGNDISWHYHSVEFAIPDDMWVYTPTMTKSSYNKDTDDYVYANPYLWDNSWGTPEWYENGVKVADFTFLGWAGVKDPMYNKYFYETWNNSYYDVPTENDNFHLFRVKFTPGVTSGEVRVKDRFGRTISKKVSW